MFNFFSGDDLTDNSQKTSLVDRFLKIFKHDYNNRCSSTLTEWKELIFNADVTKNHNKIIECPSKLATDKDSLDIEHLPEILRKKRTKTKFLEKLLSDVNKKKKVNLDEDLISLSSGWDNSEAEDHFLEAPDNQSQRIIKPMLRPNQLASETRKAQKQETDRIRRLEKKNLTLAKVTKNCTITKKKPYQLILDYNSDTKKYVEVHPAIVKHLKPHQIDGVKFMYDSCYGGIEALKKSNGSGCILAHCMGLGKTLQV